MDSLRGIRKKELHDTEMDHPFIILPEEQAPEGIRHCELCELSRQRTRVNWGEGNPSATLMMILDNPGAREDRQGDPAQGPGSHAN